MADQAGTSRDPTRRNHAPSRSTCILLCLAAGVAVGLLTPPRRLADASSYVLMAGSLWHDRDLTFEQRDLVRTQRLRFADVPAGLFLAKNGGTYSYAKPFVYPLAAAPWFGMLGIRGFFALNGLLLAALVLLGAEIAARALGWRLGLLASALTFGFSVTPAYLHWIDPFLLYSCLVAGAVVAYRRGWPGWCATLIALLGSGRVPYFLFALAPIALYALDRRWRDLRRFAAVGVMAGMTLLVAGRLLIGQWSPYLGQRYYYGAVVPYEDAGVEEVGTPASKSSTLAHLRSPTPGELARGNLYFFLGRFSGVFVYFPSLLACLVWMRRMDREKAAWMVAMLCCCLAVQLAMPSNVMGGSHTLGNRLFVLLPAALVAVDFLEWRSARVLPSALLLALAVPVIQAPVYLSIYPGRQMYELPYRWFPLEWTQAASISFPFQFPRMAALTPNQYGWEESGVWTKGASTAEFVFLRPAGDPPTVGLQSLLPAARVNDGGVSMEIDFQAGREKEITLSRPMALLPRPGRRSGPYSVYYLSIQTTAGVRPADLGINDDRRDLGVFVRPLPDPALHMK